MMMTMATKTISTTRRRKLKMATLFLVNSLTKEKAAIMQNIPYQPIADGRLAVNTAAIGAVITWQARQSAWSFTVYFFHSFIHWFFHIQQHTVPWPLELFFFHVKFGTFLWKHCLGWSQVTQPTVCPWWKQN